MRRLCVRIILGAMLACLLPAGIGPDGLALAHTAAAGVTPLVHLPSDDAMHPATATEWWYAVGHLHDSQGHRYGYEAVIFRFSHLRATVPSLRLDTVYRTDTAFTDETSKMFSGTMRYVAPASNTMMSSSVLQAHVDAVTLARVAGGGAAPLRYHVQETAPDGTRLDLTVTSTKPALLVGGAGLVPMGTHGSSYYYSLTRLETSGTILLKGRGRPIAVSGLSWMDHQWGTWDWGGIAGWDWMALQLDDGTDLNLSDFRGGEGTTVKGATISLPSGKQMVTAKATMTPLGHWRSTFSGTTYPAGWRVVEPDLGLDVIVRPTVADQEMVDRFTPDQSYWEGSCTVTGTIHGKAIHGLSYTELVGYGSAGAAGPGGSAGQ